MTKPKPIRDYIYMDLERLRSIYAQTSEGLVERIIRSEANEEEMQKDRSADDYNISKSVLLGTSQIEARVMHDYILNAVENILEADIIEVNLTGFENVFPGTFIKVTGIAEIDDTDRLITIAENFNEFQAGIYVAPYALQIQEQLWDLEEQLERAKHKKEKEDIERKISELEPNAIMRKLRVGVPELTIDILKNWLTMLYEGIFEVKILPTQSDNNVFRGILNREFLRERPELIYAKYGSRTQVQWTMFGQVTTIIDPESIGGYTERSLDVGKALQIDTSNVIKQMKSNDDNLVEQDEFEIQDDENKGLRDALENMYEAVHGIERHLLLSAHRKTWIVTPLAIYHEALVKSK